MEKDKPRQILDSTFEHLEKMIEETRRKKHEKEKPPKSAGQKSSEREKR